ncbi:MAG: hypothetical protein ACYC25_06545 [Paludibacter sp.]
MTLIILTDGFDLSLGSILALSGAFTAGMLKFGAEITGLNIYYGFTFRGKRSNSGDSSRCFNYRHTE